MEDFAGDAFDNFGKDHSRLALELMIVLAATGDSISESFIKLYAVPLELDEGYIEASTAFFSGAGLIEIVCDCAFDTMEWTEDGVTIKIDYSVENPCIVPNQSDDWYIKGFNEKRKNSSQYKDLNGRVAETRESLL